MKAIRPAVARIAASFSPSARQIAVALDGVYWVETPELPAVAGDAWIAPHVRVAPMLPALITHAPGHAQCDFGEARVIIGGVERKAHYLVLDLPHSDGCFVKAYPAETTEAFLDGRVSAFASLGGVPQSILYDNTKLAVARILGDGRRQRTRAFTELQSHYLFEDRFGRPGKGNDKGKVEGLVGYVRRNFLHFW